MHNSKYIAKDLAVLMILNPYQKVMRALLTGEWAVGTLGWVLEEVNIKFFYGTPSRT